MSDAAQVAASTEASGEASSESQGLDVSQFSTVGDFVRAQFADFKPEPQSKESDESATAPPTETPSEPDKKPDTASAEEGSVEAYVNALLQEAESESDTEDDAASDEEDESSEISELDPKSKANRRIRKLNAKFREAESKASKLEQDLEKVKAHSAKQAETLRKVSALMARKEKAQKARANPQAASDDPVEQAFTKLKPLIEQQYGNKIAQLEQRLAARDAQDQQIQQQQRQNELETQIRGVARSLRPQVLPGLDEADYDDQGFGEALDELMMTYAVGTNQRVEAVAPMFRRFIGQILQKGTKAARNRGKQLQAREPVPPTMPSSGGAAKQQQGTPFYSQKQLNDAGYNNTWEAHRNGFKAKPGMLDLRTVEPAEGWQ